MKRASFIQLWADLRAEHRLRNYGGLLPGGPVNGRADDEQSAARFWRKHRAEWAAMSYQEVFVVLKRFIT